MDLLQRQMDTILLLQKSEITIHTCVENIASEYSISPETMLALKFRLIDLVDLAKKYGRLESIHEILLKDDQTNTQKEG